MRKLLIATLLTLLPLTGQTTEATSSPGLSAYSLRDIILISAGAIAGAVVIDFLVGSALTVPATGVMTPAIQEAGAAGAVFGDQVAAATAARDAKARADVIYALTLGSGAVLGGWMFNKLGLWGSSSSATAQPQ